MFGVTLGCFNKLEEVYKFVFQTKNTVTMATENIEKTLDKKTYV